MSENMLGPAIHHRDYKPSQFSYSQDVERAGSWFKFWIADEDMIRLNLTREEYKMVARLKEGHIQTSERIAILAYLVRLMENIGEKP